MILIDALNILRLAFLNIGLSTQINQRSMVLRVADAQYVLFGEWGRGEITISASLVYQQIPSSAPSHCLTQPGLN